jgi:undecaprenyl-diphosphatase
MSDFFATVLLGFVEGITEFLPISSTGHLLIAQHWLGHRSELFNVAIQAGAILGVVVVYWRRLLDLAFRFRAPENHAYVARLCLSFAITVAGALGAKQLGLELPDTVAPIAWALMIGGVVILFVERLVKNAAAKDRVTWRVAVWVGIGQIVAAVFPGTSRSAATIFAAMIAGLTSRPAAAEFSFLLGIPTMFAATAYELLKQWRGPGLHGEDWGSLGVGLVVAAVVAFASVKWLLHHIQTHRFTVFAWYRIVVGAALLLFVP